MSSQLISEDLLKQAHHSLCQAHENSFGSAAAHPSAHTFLAGVGVPPSPDSPATSARGPSEAPRLAPPRHLASNVQAPWSSKSSDFCIPSSILGDLIQPHGLPLT